MNLDNAYFFTLTFDKRKADRENYDVCVTKTRNWMQNIKKIPGADDLSYVFVLELHKDMKSWHVHGVMSNVGELSFVDSGEKDKRGRKVYNISRWKYGFSYATKVDNSPMSSVKISNYVTKYITKLSVMISHSKHRYSASKNIPKPITEKYYCENDYDVDEKLYEIYMCGYTVVSEKKYHGDYNDIKYIEAIEVKNIDNSVVIKE